MKNIQQKKRFLIIVILLIGTIRIDAFSEDKMTYKIGWEPWKPYQFKNEQRELTGLDVELGKAIIHKMNCTTKYIKLPWLRQLAYVRQGTIDMVAGASKTSERQVYAYFSNFYRNESNVIFVLKGTTKKYPFKHLSEIKNTRFHLGITNGYHYGETFAELMKDATFKKHIQGVPSDNVNIKKTLRNRVHGFIGDIYAGIAALKKEGVRDQFEIHPVPVSSSTIHMMFSKKSCTQKDVDLFNIALKQLKENGHLESIFRKYTN